MSPAQDICLILVKLYLKPICINPSPPALSSAAAGAPLALTGGVASSHLH